MKNSKLLLLANTFSPQEIHRFRLYLQSPYHNANPLFYELFEAIRPFLHSRNKNEINALLVWKQINKKAKFNSLQFNKYCSALYQLAANFVSLNQLEQKSNTIQLNYLQVLNDRKLNELFPFHAQTLALSISTQIHSPSVFYDQFQLQLYNNAHQEILQSRTKNRNTSEVLAALDNFYLHYKLKYWSAALHYKKMFDQPVEILWEDFMLEYLQKNKMMDEQIEVGRKILLMEQNKDGAANYKWLKEKLFQSKSKIAVAAQKEICLFLINYCIEQINSGNAKFYKEIFEVYKQAIGQKLLIQKKSISPWDFKNIITVALQQKEISWTENFIKTYSSYLPTEESKNANNYNLAKVYFIQKKYNESLKLLQEVAYTDLFYQLDIKVMQAKTLYELQEWDTLDDLIVSFKKLLVRKRKLSAHYQKRYKKFLSYLQILLKNVSKKQIDLLANDNEVPDKNWLMEKMKLSIQ